ncbi:MAG TPA: hypothetical protein VES67_25750 [Vicinamibacterales bacterium]|nr:hypothetical protein [Vicinamibacterales bacterium]
MRKAADDLRAAVKRIIDAADIEGLLKMGAPEDEYDLEISLIAARLNSLQQPSVPAIEAIVFDVWQTKFGPLEGHEEACRYAIRPVAESLFAEISRG